MTTQKEEKRKKDKEPLTGLRGRKLKMPSETTGICWPILRKVIVMGGATEARFADWSKRLREIPCSLDQITSKTNKLVFQENTPDSEQPLGAKFKPSITGSIMPKRKEKLK